MKTIHVRILVLFLLLLSFGCKNEKSNDTTEQNLSSTGAQTQDEIPSYARYGFETGKIEMEMSTMGMKQTMTIHFQDWGNIARTDIVMNFAGMKQELSSLTKDGWTYTWDNKNRIGQKFPLQEFETDQINYLKIKDADTELKQKYNIQYKGEKEIQGKTCQVFVLKPQHNVELTVAIWEGIPMETEAKAQGITTKITVKKLDLNISIDNELFELPANVTFQEITVPTQKGL